MKPLRAFEAADSTKSSGIPGFSRSLDHMGIGLALVSMDQRLLHVSNRLCEILCLSRQQLLSTPLKDLLRAGKLDPDTIDPTVVKELNEGKREFFAFEKEFLRRGGERISVKVTVSRSSESMTGERKYIALFEDISEKKRLEEKAKEAFGREAAQRQIADYSPDMISRHDPNCVFTYVSPASSTLVGFEPSELLGHSGLDFVHPEDREKMSVVHAQLSQTVGTSPQYSLYRFRKKDNSYLWFETISRTIRHPITQEIVEIVCNSRDVSERLQKLEEEKTIRGFFDSAPILMGIVETEADDILHIWDNPATARYFKKTPEQMVNHYSSELGASPASIKLWLEAFSQAEKMSEPYNVDLPHETADDARWLSLSASYLGKSLSGRSRFSYGVFDVSQRKAAEERLDLLSRVTAKLDSSFNFRTQLHELAHSLLPILADCCLLDIIHQDGAPERAVIAHVDPAVEKALNEMTLAYPIRKDRPYRTLEVIEKGRALLFSEFPADEIYREVAQDCFHYERLKSLLKAKSVMIVPLRAKTKIFGAITLMSSRPNLRYDEKSLSFAQELSSRVAFSIENAKLFQEAQEAIASRDLLLAAVSHDLRNPLSMLSMGAKYILDLSDNENSNSEIAEVAHRMASATGRMESLVADLLEAGRASSGNILIEKKPHSFFSLIAETIEMLRPIAEKKNVKLRVHSEALPKCPLDGKRIYQVLSNVLSNAIKFSPQDEVVDIIIQKVGHDLSCSVTDAGPGVDPDELSKIFDKFYRCTQHRNQGTGLGLFIAKSLVEAHKGRIWAESDGHRGTKITVTLPLKAPPTKIANP